MLGYTKAEKDMPMPSALDALAEAAADLRGLALTLQTIGGSGVTAEGEQLTLCGEVAELIAEAVEGAAASLGVGSE